MAELIALSGVVKIKSLKVEQKSSKIVLEAEFENEEQAKIVLEIFNKYRSLVGGVNG